MARAIPMFAVEIGLTGSTEGFVLLDPGYSLLLLAICEASGCWTLGLLASDGLRQVSSDYALPSDGIWKAGCRTWGLLTSD